MTIDRHRAPKPVELARDGRLAFELFAELRELELPAGDYAIFGSGPLAARGLLEHISDLDVLTRGEAWSRVCDLAGVATDTEEVVDLGKGLTFGRTWAYGDFDIGELIDEAEEFFGLPFVRLEAVVEFKRLANRAKDREHLALLRGLSIGNRF